MPQWFSKIKPEDLIDKDIFELLDLADAPEEQKQKMREDMLETIQNRILARILDNLTEEECSRFKDLLDTGTPADTDAFFEEKQINVEQIAAQEALRYKVEMLNLIAAKEIADDETENSGNNQPVAE